MLEEIEVYRLILSEQARIGIGIFLPNDENKRLVVTKKSVTSLELRRQWSDRFGDLPIVARDTNPNTI